MSKIKGSSIMLFVKNNGVNKAIAYATNHTLEISSELTNTSNKDQGGGDWSSQEVGQLSWTVSSENFYALDSSQNTYNDLFDLMIAKQPIDVMFASKAETTINDVVNTSTGYWTPAVPKYTGKALINTLNLNAPNGDYATFTVNLTGAGALTKTNS